MAGGNCEKDTFGNDCHDPILNDATPSMVWFVCCLFDDCQSDSDVEDDSNGGSGNDDVDGSSTRSPSSSCSSAQAPPDGSRGHVVRVLLTDFTPTRFLTSKYYLNYLCF